MVRPHDIWEFGWSCPFDERHAYIQSLPENEQEWATMLFHYIDMAFESEMYRQLDRIRLESTNPAYSDKVEQIRHEVKDRLEPPTDDRWKTRFQPGWYDRFYGKDTDD